MSKINLNLLWNYLLRVLKNDLEEEQVNRYVAVCNLKQRGYSLCVVVPSDEIRAWIEENAFDLMVSHIRRFTGVAYVFLETAAQEEQVLITAEQEQQHLYQEIVNPRKIILLPGYFKYWIPVVGPGLAWMYVAFRQLAYLATRGRKKGNYSIAITMTRLAQMCGISRYGLYKRLSSPDTWEKLNGLVCRMPDKNRPDNTYSVNLSLPLTPHHSASLLSSFEVLANHQAGTEDLQVFCNYISPEELSDNAVSPSRPRTIREIFDASGLSIEPHFKPTFIANLYEKIMPDRDIILFSHFFFEEIMPILGEAEAWIYILLKQLTRKEDNPVQEITVPGGYAQIAGMIGFSRYRTVYDYFNDISPLSVYLSVVPQTVPKNRMSASNKTNFWNQERKFRILTADLPFEAITFASLTRVDLNMIQNFGAIHLSELPPQKLVLVQEAAERFVQIVQENRSFD